jgi:hypothetical protein
LQPSETPTNATWATSVRPVSFLQPLPAVDSDPSAAKTDRLAVLDQKLDAILKNLTVVTGDPAIKIILGGAIIGDFLYIRRLSTPALAKLHFLRSSSALMYAASSPAL